MYMLFCLVSVCLMSFLGGTESQCGTNASASRASRRRRTASTRLFLSFCHRRKLCNNSVCCSVVQSAFQGTKHSLEAPKVCGRVIGQQISSFAQIYNSIDAPRTISVPGSIAKKDRSKSPLVHMLNSQIGHASIY